MLTEFFAYLKNYFLRDREQDIHVGTFTISDGSIEPLDFLLEGQYFRIVGSLLNDGVYQYPATGLADETFSGAVWAMAVPPAVIALAGEIEVWKAENAETLDSPFASESFGGYSYSKGTSASGTGAYTWQDQFASRLNPWRRLSVL